MITKEQWAEIEEKLTGIFGHAEFKLGSEKITVERRQVKEGKYELVVFFNGIIKGAWHHHPESKNYQPLIEKFWRKVTRSYYSPKRKALLYKRLGKKRAQELFSDLDEKHVYYLPFWPKAKALINHFKKNKGLELIEPESKSQETTM